MVRKKKRASNPRKNIALTAKEIESSSSPNKISESHTSKMETMNEIKIKQEEDLDAEEEKLQRPITIIKNDIRFEDLQTFSKNITWKYPFKHSLEILKLSKTEKTSKETHIDYFYRVKEIASRINMEEEAEKYYIIRGLKENRAIEIQLQSCSNIEELKEKMKLLDIQEKSKSSKNEVIYLKYPMTRIPYHTNQFAHRQQYGGWNWRNDQSQHPDTITNTRYKVYSPQFPSPYHYPSFSRQRPTLYPRNQQFPQRPSILRPNAPTFYSRQRIQNNNTVFQPHQT
ncbi:hypothetical protein TNCV_2176471 [Trichonephila clavipes]|uniref:Uncharacterized protein n=1 Tax=Trichonephila clavipes TaxID=2585209 RepID=A0A8X6VTZ7_TRICX|nr:hypothetical protein TNCV_2176471 [Trichonephila clavipes]